jgi:hypothetical protein
MRTRYSIKTLYTLLLSVVALASVAQEEQTKSTLSRELTLEREYNPSVQDANKVNTLPAVKEPVVTSVPVDYATLSLPADPAREIGLLPAARILQDIAYNKRRGYANLGLGAYRSINGDAGYHLLSNEKNQLSLFFSHRSTQGNVKYAGGYLKDQEVEARANDNLGGLAFRHDFEAVALQLGVHYGYSAFNYYGQPSPSTHSSWPAPVPDTETNQISRQFTAKAAIESKGLKKLNYLLDFGYTRFSYKYAWDNSMEGIVEHAAGANMKWYIAWGADQQLGLATKFNYFFYNLPSSSISSFDTYLEGTLTPYYRLEGNLGYLMLGVNLMFVTPQGQNNTKAFASPQVGGELRLGAKTLAYAKAGGEIRSNSAFQLSRENRYSDPYMSATPSRTWLDVVAGLKSGILPGFWVNLYGQYKMTDDDYFFIPDLTSEGFGNISSILSMDSRLLKGGIELKYAYRNLFELTLKGAYNHWDEDKADTPVTTLDFKLIPKRQAYGRPKAELAATISLHPVEPLALTVDYRRLTGRTTLVNISNEAMNDIDELNFAASYAFSNTFGVYLKAKNLLFKSYELIYGYPLQGFSVMAGVNVNF